DRDQVATSASVEARDTFAAHDEVIARLNAGRDFHARVFFFASDLQRRERDLAAERGVRERDLEVVVQIDAVAAEVLVRRHLDDDEEVSRRSTAHAGLTLAREAKRLAFVDAGRDV